MDGTPINENSQDDLAPEGIEAQILKMVSDAVLMTDGRGIITCWNPGATRILGWSAADMLGHPLTSVVSDVLPAGMETSRMFAGDSGEVQGELAALHKNGSRVRLFAHVRPLPTESSPGTLLVLSTASEPSALSVSDSARQRFTDAFAAVAPLTLYVFNVVDRVIEYSNFHVLRDLGYQETQVARLDWNWLSQMVHPDDFQRMQSQMSCWETATDDDVFETEYRLKHADGNWRWFVSRDKVFTRNASGIVQQIVGTIEDITDRVLLLDQAQRSEQRLHSMFDALLEGCQIIGFDWRYIYVNSVAARHGRRLPEELIGRRMIEVYPGIDQTPLFATLQDCMVNRTPRVLVNIFTYLDGSQGNFEISVRPWPEGLLILSIDVTERLRAEGELRESEERLRTALTAAAAVGLIWDVPRDEVVRYFSSEPALPLNLGAPTTLEEMLTAVHPEDSERFRTWLMEGALSGSSRQICRVARSDGDVRWLEWYGDFQRDAAGRPIRFSGIGIDVSDRIRADDERDRLWMHALDPLCILGLTGVIRQVNPAWERILNWQAGDLIGLPLLSFVHPEDSNATSDALHDLAQGRPLLGFENRLRCRDGKFCRLSWTGIALPDRRSIFVSARDVTSQKSLEDQLRHSQKMEAIGQLAGGIAHDFNNLTTVITGYGSLLQKEMPPEKSWRFFVDEILKAAQSATDLVKRLLAFSRRQPLEPTLFDLNRLVAGSETLLRPLLGDGVILKIQCNAVRAAVWLDRGEMEQILLNLASNARDAMNGQGELTIETTDDEFSVRTEASEWATRPAVKLSIRDTGSGMDAATLKCIFEPFFTTKSPGHGTGLGLATVYSIVQQSGGTIDVRSDVGHGATFDLRFPPADLVPETSDSPPAPSVMFNGAKSGTLLLVEDFEQLRNLEAKLLREQGYHVIEAANGIEALERFSEIQGNIDLLVTDITMPHMSGTQLAVEIRRQQSSMRVLFLSGHLDKPLLRECAALGTYGWLQKPYSPGELLQEIDRLLQLE